MHGLDALGARLKQIRLQSGRSQMMLAKLIGFDPAHGYKYILRLEKGQVPNPTLRTIAACLEACGAQWQAIVDVLPDTGAVSAPPSPKSSIDNRKSEIPLPAASSPQSSIDNRKSEIPSAVPEPSPAAPRRRDHRPLREQLRARRIEQRDLRTRRFWSGVKQVDEATAALLRSLRVPSRLHRSYLAFARSCCSTSDALEAARPEVAERALARLIPPAVAQGLDRGILAQIQSACAQVFHPQSSVG